MRSERVDALLAEVERLTPEESEAFARCVFARTGQGLLLAELARRLEEEERHELVGELLNVLDTAIEQDSRRLMAEGNRGQAR